jgi:hypothetical protein
LEKPNQIRQCSLNFDGLGTLGVKDIVVAFTYLRSRPEEKKDRIALIVSGATILQDFLEKPTLKDTIQARSNSNFDVKC